METKQTGARSVILRVTEGLLVVTGLVLLVFGILSAYRANATMVGVCVAGAILLIFAANIDRFESLKGLGIEAKTRQLDEKLVEADLALDRLRELAEILGTESVAANSKLGRTDSAPTAEESYAHAQETRRIMEHLGSKPEAIKEMLRPFIRMQIFDAGRAILQPVADNLFHNLSRLSGGNKLTETPEEAASRFDLQDRAYEFQNLLRNSYTLLSVEDYPHALLARLAQAPLIDEEVRSAAMNELLRFSADIVLMRSEGRLERPGDWFRKITEHRNRGH